MITRRRRSDEGFGEVFTESWPPRELKLTGA